MQISEEAAVGSVGAACKISPDWSQETMTCHSSNCFSIFWDQGNAALVTKVVVTAAT